MPHLQFDITRPSADEEKDVFAEEIADRYTEHMATTVEHVAVSIRERDPGDLWLGRAVEGRLCFLDADIRQGRSQGRRRSFALAAMDAVHERWGVPEPNMKVVFTEHPGPDMMGVDRVGGEWSKNE